RERLGADRCVYGNVDRDGRSFSYAAVACAPDVGSIGGGFRLSEHIRTALLERGPLVVDDTETLPVASDRQNFGAIGARALLVSPLGLELMREAAGRPALLESLRTMMDRQLAHLI